MRSGDGQQAFALAESGRVDAVLLLGGVLGAQFGARASSRFRAEELRAVLGLIVLLVGMQMGLDLFVRPSDLFLLAPGIADG